MENQEAVTSVGDSPSPESLDTRRHLTLAERHSRVLAESIECHKRSSALMRRYHRERRFMDVDERAEAEEEIREAQVLAKDAKNKVLRFREENNIP